MSERPRIALVTGGSGFIGSHLVERLVRDRWRVRILDSRAPAGAWFNSLETGAVEVVTDDIRDAAAVDRAARGTDVIFHQAAIASVQRSIDDPQETVEVNIGGTLNVLEAARQAGSRRVVFASSAAVYGDGPESPKVETLPPRPLSPYAVSKLTGEQLCAVYAHLHGLETVSLRYFNVYGPRQDPTSPYSGVISKFVDAIQHGEPVTIYGDGEQTRDFVCVGDVVEANMLAAEAQFAMNHVLNVGSGIGTSLNALIATISALTGMSPQLAPLPERPGDIRHSLASIVTTGNVLSYRPEFSLAAALAAMTDP